jgi:hypothetical protein
MQRQAPRFRLSLFPVVNLLLCYSSMGAQRVALRKLVTGDNLNGFAIAIVTSLLDEFVNGVHCLKYTTRGKVEPSVRG